MTAADADVLVKRMRMMMFANPVGEGRAYNFAVITCTKIVWDMVDDAQSTVEYRRSSARCRKPNGEWRE